MENLNLGQCDFCGRSDVVLISGYRYCRECLSRYDMGCMHITLTNAFPSLTLNYIKGIMCEMFFKEIYKYSDLSIFYNIVDRGAEKDGWYMIPTNRYLITVFKHYLQTHHTNMFERIKNEGRE